MARNPALSRRSLGGLAASLGLSALGPGTSFAQRPEGRPAVDLALVLAVDVSGSVNQRRFELQRDGYAAAFEHPSVRRAIRSGPSGSIAVCMLQWTGPQLQVEAVAWTAISDDASIGAWSSSIRAAPRQLFSGGTSISGAIDHASILLDRLPFKTARRIIDVSGDGANNRGRPAPLARDEAVAKGVTINGLPILELEPSLDEHYKQNVIGGQNAFLVVAQNFEEFADAILKKLVTEIAWMPAATRPPA